MVISRLLNRKTRNFTENSQDNNRASTTQENPRKNSEEESRATNSELLKKTEAPRPPAKSIEQISQFSRIPKLEDINNSAIIDKAGAKKILTRFSIGSANNAAFTCKDGNHLSVFCGDSKLGFKNGLQSIFGSWFGLKKIFTGFDSRVALKFISSDGLIDLVDKNETKLDKAQLAQGVKSGEYKLVYIYQSGDGKETSLEQKLDKEPLAIAVLQDYSIMLKTIEDKFNSNVPDKSIQEKLKFQEEINKLKSDQSLQNIFACENILINPKKKDQFTDSKINNICKNISECLPPKTTLIFPRSIVGNTAEAQSKNKRYSSIDWRHLENKEGKWDFIQKPITIVRDIDHGQDQIPESFLTINQFHNIAKIKDIKSMDPSSITKIIEAQEFNRKTLRDYDESLLVPQENTNEKSEKKQESN
jgi:hypothetical protein